MSSLSGSAHQAIPALAGSRDRAALWAFVLCAALILLGAVRIVATYGVFSNTYDEPAHVATGMEWLDRGQYRYEPQHPPLARVATALGPWLDGSRSLGIDRMWDEGDAILYGRGTYRRTLALARAGVLPFFVLGAVVVGLWAWRLHGRWAACIAVGAFTTLPPVLAHAGFATTDMAVTATFTLAVFAAMRWLDAPGWRTGLAFGAATGLALLCKFTTLLFLPACLAAILAWRGLLWLRGRDAGTVPSLPDWIGSLGAACAAGFLVIWAGYRFSFGSIAGVKDVVHPMIEAQIPAGWLRAAAQHVADIPIPFPELFYGLISVGRHNASGHLSYLLGQYGETGWWYYFPVAVLVKTPLAFLALAAVGCGAALGRSWRSGDWRVAVPALCAAAILIAVLPSRINIGLRHVLPLYPFLCIALGFGAVRMAQRFGRPGAAVVALLLAWHLGAGIRAHPDYLSSFNEVAAREPEGVLLISDLDWGQDLHRLSDRLATLGVTRVSAFLLGHCDGIISRDLSRLGIPDARRFDPGDTAQGWVAVSMAALMSPRLDWLRAQYGPGIRVGESIRLFHLPDVPGAPLPPPCGAPVPEVEPIGGWKP